jgi:hypothetical protein
MPQNFQVISQLLAENIERLNYPFLNIQVCRDVTQCRMINSYRRFEESCAFAFRHEQFKTPCVFIFRDCLTVKEVQTSGELLAQPHNVTSLETNRQRPRYEDLIHWISSSLYETLDKRLNKNWEIWTNLYPSALYSDGAWHECRPVHQVPLSFVIFSVISFTIILSVNDI